MGIPLFLTLAGLVLISSTAYGLVYDVFLKEGKRIVNLHREGKNLVVEEIPIGGRLPLFETFKVERVGKKLFLEWKSLNHSVKKVLVITDKGGIKVTTSRKLEIPIPRDVNLLRIFPIGKDGEIGLPAEVRLGG